MSSMNSEQIISNSDREQEIQTFLQKYPFLIDYYSSWIPKKKLGEYFVTDFVLCTNCNQGSEYVLIEIESAHMRISD